MSSFKRQSDYEKRYQQPTGLCGNGAALLQRTAGGAELLHQLWQCGRYGGVGCPRRRDSAAADGGTGASGKQHRPRHAADICRGADRLCRTDYRPERGTHPEHLGCLPAGAGASAAGLQRLRPYHSRSALPQTQAVKRKHNAVCPNRAIIAVVL